jgi:hypothetical protein
MLVRNLSVVRFADCGSFQFKVPGVHEQTHPLPQVVPDLCTPTPIRGPRPSISAAVEDFMLASAPRTKTRTNYLGNSWQTCGISNGWVSMRIPATIGWLETIRIV